MVNQRTKLLQKFVYENFFSAQAPFDDLFNLTAKLQQTKRATPTKNKVTIFKWCGVTLLVIIRQRSSALSTKKLQLSIPFSSIPNYRN